MIQIFTHLRTFDEQARWGGRTPGKLGCNKLLSTYSHFAMIAGERSVYPEVPMKCY